jgi:hypothetical protein
MKRIPVPTGALIAGAALAQVRVEDAITSEAKFNLSPVEIVSSAGSHQSILPDAENIAASIFSHVRTIASDEWTPRMESRFLKLAEKEAIGALKSLEGPELDRLSSSRVIAKVPRSGEEVLREYEQRKLTHELVTALQRYVQFYKPAHRQKK